MVSPSSRLPVSTTRRREIATERSMNPMAIVVSQQVVAAVQGFACDFAICPSCYKGSNTKKKGVQ